MLLIQKTWDINDCYGWCKIIGVTSMWLWLQSVNIAKMVVLKHVHEAANTAIHFLKNSCLPKDCGCTNISIAWKWQDASRSVQMLKMCSHFTTNHKCLGGWVQQSDSLYRHEVRKLKHEEMFKHLWFNGTCLKDQRIKMSVWVETFVCMYAEKSYCRCVACL